MKNKILPSQLIFSKFSGRASVSASYKGSMTVEAAMTVPLFFLAVVSLLYLLEGMAIQTAIRSGLQYAGKKAAEDSAFASVLSPTSIENDVIHAIGAERLERSIVVGGSTGIECGRSKMSMQTGIGDIEAVYHIRIPVPVFRVPSIERKEKMRIKAWNGYEKAGFGTEQEETVYVTETGIVYHKDYHCTHLELSIRMISRSEVGKIRNQSGGMYHSCEYCGKKMKDAVYITETGNRYHSSLSCSGLKRTVYAVPLSEVVGKGVCSRCGQ